MAGRPFDDAGAWIRVCEYDVDAGHAAAVEFGIVECKRRKTE
jgi:hypothetical protein